VNTGGEDQRVPRRYIAQGEYAIGVQQDEVIATVLGSCVAVCLYDADRRMGGMNHILLPAGDSADDRRMLFGAHSMEVLINELMKRGASRQTLRAKIFGGACMIDTLGRAGQMNGEFAERYLQSEGIPVESRSLGGALARRVEFWPATGRARMRFIEDVAVLDERHQKPPQSNGVELF
jgi:chemotaxis protein CheD